MKLFAAALTVAVLVEFIAPAALREADYPPGAVVHLEFHGVWQVDLFDLEADQPAVAYENP